METEVLLEELTAPVKTGDVIGTVRYSLGGEVLAEVDITAAGDVEAVTFASALGYLFRGFSPFEKGLPGPVGTFLERVPYKLANCLNLL